MRRIAPWLPIAIALGAVTFTTFRALALQGMRPESFSGAVVWMWAYAGLYSYAVPYAIPLLLLDVMKNVRHQSAAPPVAGGVALISALPALLIAVWWPLDVARRFAIDPHTPLIHAVTIDNWVSISVWFASVVTTAAWLFAAACRWYWFPRPVVIVGTPPYR